MKPLTNLVLLLSFIHVLAQTKPANQLNMSQATPCL